MRILINTFLSEVIFIEHLHSKHKSPLLLWEVRFICEKWWIPPSAGAVIILHFLCDAASVADSENTLVGGLSIKTHVTDLMVGHGSAPTTSKYFHPRVWRVWIFQSVHTRWVRSHSRRAATCNCGIYAWPHHKHRTERCHSKEKNREQAPLSSCPPLIIGLSISQPDWKEHNQRVWLQGCLRTRVVFQF